MDDNQQNDDKNQTPTTGGQYPTANPPQIVGEQSVSGSAPDSEADDDTLVNAQAVGMQLNEDSEHP